MPESRNRRLLPLPLLLLLLLPLLLLLLLPRKIENQVVVIPGPRRKGFPEVLPDTSPEGWLRMKRRPGGRLFHTAPFLCYARGPFFRPSLTLPRRALQ